MIYKDLCPPTVHLPYSAAQDGLQFLAVSHQTRADLLSYLCPSFLVFASHLHAFNTVNEFLGWTRPNTIDLPNHAADLLLRRLIQPYADTGSDGSMIYCELCSYLRAHDVSREIVCSVMVGEPELSQPGTCARVTFDLRCLQEWMPFTLRRV